MKSPAPITGVIVPVLTPLTESGVVDEQAFRRLVNRCIRAGCHAIFVGGSAGMGPMLTDAQWEQAVDIAASETLGKVRLLVGIIATSTQRALNSIRISQRYGCETIVVTPTFYITLRRDDEMIAHFRACFEATDQSMVIYNIPSCTNSSISVPVIRACAENGWTHAIKESSGDRAYFSKVLALGQELGLSVLQGNEPDIAWGLQQGASGIVPVCANCEPSTFVRAYDAAQAGHFDELATLQQRIDVVRDTILVGDHNWISGLFCALQELGISDSQPLLPLQPVDEARRLRISQFLAGQSCPPA
jgi:4-hydroxy-tetrahydrodipicolinate synthase